MIQVQEDISIVICAYTEKRWHDLVEAVASVQRQTTAYREIIVVIDYNPVLFRQAQEQLTGVVVVENTQTKGLRGARNSGIAHAQGQIIAFLDDDAVAIPDWLRFLCEGYTDERVLGTGGAITPLWAEQKPRWFPEEFYWVVGCTYRGMPQEDAIIRNPIGANMSFRREIFDAVGGFERETASVGSLHAGGCEETELCIRAHQVWPQRVFLYHSQANVFHRVPASRTNWHYFWFRCYVEGLAKAAMTQYVGAKDGLTSEYKYTLQTLPLGVVHGLSDTLRHRDLTGLGRAGAIITGLLTTMVGYVQGKIALQQEHLRNAISKDLPFWKKATSLIVTTPLDNGI